MRDVQKTLSISLIMLAIILSIVFTFGILQYLQPVSTQGDAPSASGGKVSLRLEPPEYKEDDSDAQVNLHLLPPGG